MDVFLRALTVYLLQLVWSWDKDKLLMVVVGDSNYTDNPVSDGCWSCFKYDGMPPIEATAVGFPDIICCLALGEDPSS